VKKLGQLCAVVPGFAFKSQAWQDFGVPVIKIKNIQNDNNVEISDTEFVSEELASRTPAKFVLNNGDFLLAMTGATAGKIGRLRSQRPMLLNQRVAKILPRDGSASFVWCAISSEESKDRFFRLADGAAQPNMSGSQVEGVKLVTPPRDLLNSFSRLTEAMLAQTDSLYLKNLNLRRSRDVLLPRLLSEEIALAL
jgi:type I restriction enzyme S subunit